VENVLQSRAVADDLLKPKFAADLLLEIDSFLRKFYVFDLESFFGLLAVVDVRCRDIPADNLAVLKF